MPCVDCGCLRGEGVLLARRGQEGQGLTPVHPATMLLCCGSGKGPLSPRVTPCPVPPLSGPRALALSCPPLPQLQEAKALTLALPVPPFPTPQDSSLAPPPAPAGSRALTLVAL